MKKLIVLLVLSVICLSSCAGSSKSYGKDISRYINLTEYYEKEIEKDIYKVYDPWNSSTICIEYATENVETPEQLIESSKYVFTARIQDVSFKNDPESGFCTLYTVEILKTYYGDTSGINTLYHKGGLVGYMTDEQLSVLGGEKIPIFSHYMRTDCHIGETYLFVLKESLKISDPILSIYDMSDPSTSAELGAFTANEIINECRFGWIRDTAPIVGGAVAALLVIIIVLKIVVTRKKSTKINT